MDTVVNNVMQVIFLCLSSANSAGRISMKSLLAIVVAIAW